MNLFGNLFDFNGDGKTDFIEEMMGLEILDEIERDEQKKRRDEFFDEECEEFEDDGDYDEI